MKWTRLAMTTVLGSALGAAIAAALGQLINWAQAIVK